MAVLELSWTSPGAAVAGCPSVMPTSAGPRIIVGTSTGDAAGLDGAGREIWRTPIGASVLLWPAIDTVPGTRREHTCGNRRRRDRVSLTRR